MKAEITRVERRNPYLIPLIPESELIVPEPMLRDVPDYESYEIVIDSNIRGEE